MYVQVHGSGGPRGWPQPGCRCASCLRAGANGPGRAPGRVVVDGFLQLAGPRLTVLPGAGPDQPRGPDGPGGLPAEWDPGTERGLAGYQVRRLPGGWDVTAPDGARLLAGTGTGSAVTAPPAARYDIALLDLPGHPEQLGRLRAQGAVTQRTLAGALFADHRVTSERELSRRCRIWRARPLRDGETLITPAPAVPGAELRQLPCRALVLGGARSGKSAEAELRVAAEAEVTYVATGQRRPADPEWAARVEAHRVRRPAWWRTVESTDLAGILRQADGAVLVDSITTWLTAMMDECGAWEGATAPTAPLGKRIADLVAAWRQTTAYIVAVSDETGLSVVPETRAGRMFRDELGRLNQILAAESDEFVLVVAGQAVTIGDGMLPCG
jgi:adenosylcobinamide kinase / adenosylcobinamide-phosphate guanylyltransferase